MIIVGSILAVLWLGDIIGRLTGNPMLDSPTDEPLAPVYILDLGFVIPAGLYGAIQSLRKRFWGYSLTAVMLVMVAVMGFALMAMTLGHYAYGYEPQSFLTVFSVTSSALKVSWANNDSGTGAEFKSSSYLNTCSEISD